AVGAAHLAGLGDVEEHPGVVGPDRRARHRAVQRQVALGDLDQGLGLDRFGHHFPFVRAFAFASPTGVSHSLYRLLRPLTRSKNAFWIFVVTGPRRPRPIVRPSTSRIGVTSAAVPVKNASSAM